MAGVANYALRLEYDGGPFAGWQRQGDRPTVQKAVEEAAAVLNGGVPASSIVAGRTDAGVHASAQVAQLSLTTELSPERVREAIEFHLRPHPISVIACARSEPDWSARFSAVGRSYRYRISDRRARPALEAGRVWHVRRRLDEAAMHTAAQRLLGYHDFSAFRASSCQASGPMRTLDRLDVFRRGDEVLIEVEARSFLHHQIRNFAGTLVEVGFGRRPADWPRQVLDGRDRAAAGQTAPPQGLCLISVVYNPDLDWR